MIRIGVSSPAVKAFDKNGVLEVYEVELIEVALDKIDMKKDIIGLCRKLKHNYDLKFTAHAPYHSSLVEWQRINLAYISEKNFKIMNKVFEICSKIDAKFIVLHGGAFEREYEYLHKKGLRNLIKNLKYLCKKAENYDIVLVLENTHSDKNYKKIGETPEEIKYILENVESDNIMVNIDFGHANISSKNYNFDIMKYFNILSEKIVYLHLHNNNSIDDMHHPLFSGSINYKKILPKIFKKLKNLKNVVLEVKYGGKEGIIGSINIVKEALKLRNYFP